MTANVKKVKHEEISDTEEMSCPPCHDAEIAELAYCKAEKRGFEPGHEMDDWLEAERELTGCEGMSD